MELENIIYIVAVIVIFIVSLLGQNKNKKVKPQTTEPEDDTIYSLNDFEKILDRVAKMFELKPEEVLIKANQRLRVKARSLLCYWAVNELEMTGAAVGRRLKMSKSTVSRAARRGEKIANDLKLQLFED